jgi:hypothetical protein
MIDPRSRIYMLVLGLAVLAFVLNMVRTRKLQERYALVWVLAGVGLTVAPLAIHWLDALAYALGFDYPPALLLMVAIVALLLIILQLSLTISQNANHLKLLTQELGLLRQEVAALEQRLAAQEAATGVADAGTNQADNEVRNPHAIRA